ncbi:hypothetical protein FY526_20440, partial [Clostridioides difficile]
LEVTFEYSTILFEKTTIEAMSQNLLVILTTIANDPHIEIKKIQLVEELIDGDTLADLIEVDF